MPKHAKQERGHSCLAATPWLALLCSLVVIASIPVWFIFSTSAAGHTQRALRDTGEIATIFDEVLDVFSAIRVAVLVALIVCMLLVVLVATFEILRKVKRPNRGSYGGLLMSSAVGAALLWLTLAGVVVLIAFCTSWLVGSWAGSALLDQASNISTSAEAAAQKAVESAQQLVRDLKNTQLGTLDAAPGDVKSSSWFRDYYRGVQDINATSLLPANLQGSSSSSAVCQPGCISLDVLAGLAGLDNGCLCLTNTLQGLKEGLTAAKEDLLPALIGLAICYLAASLLLTYLASNYAAAKHLRRQHLSQPADLAVPAPPGLPYSGNGIDHVAYAVPADAAVNIHGDSPVSLQEKQAAVRPGYQGVRGVTGNSSNYASNGYVVSPRVSQGLLQQVQQDALRSSRDRGSAPMSYVFGDERPVVH